MEKFIVSRDDSVYEAWPHLALTASEKLVCVFSECTHHNDRSYTRIVTVTSTDRGRTWSAKRPLTEPCHDRENFWNCARISNLSDGRLAIAVDRQPNCDEAGPIEKRRNYLFFSSDEGETWKGPVDTPALGGCPDKLLELESGRWLYSCTCLDPELQTQIQRLWYSDNQGESWSGPVIVAKKKGLKLCEVSILPVKDKLVAFHREESREGWDCYKTISADNGETWSDVIRFPLPGCHRPAAGRLNNGQILITYRFVQGGKGRRGYWVQNLFSGLTDDESALATDRRGARTRIMPIDFDRSASADTGYSGWVQFKDGEIYVVNYIMDDAPCAQIRGYSLQMSDLILEER